MKPIDQFAAFALLGLVAWLIAGQFVVAAILEAIN